MFLFSLGCEKRRDVDSCSVRLILYWICHVSIWHDVLYTVYLYSLCCLQVDSTICNRHLTAHQIYKVHCKLKVWFPLVHPHWKCMRPLFCKVLWKCYLNFKLSVVSQTAALSLCWGRPTTPLSPSLVLCGHLSPRKASRWCSGTQEARWIQWWLSQPLLARWALLKHVLYLIFFVCLFTWVHHRTIALGH